MVLVIISDGRANVPLAVSEGEELLTAEAQARERERARREKEEREKERERERERHRESPGPRVSCKRTT